MDYFNKSLPDYPDYFVFKGKTLMEVIGGLLPYIYVVAGLILLMMLIVGGATLMTAAGDPGKTKDGYGKITAGLIGFLLIFVSYMVVQVVEVMLGVKIF